jgi:cytochrome b
MPDEASARGRRARVWDWPTRIAHWLFVLLIPLAWWTAEEDAFDWHRRIGYLLLALILFRLLWGFFGSSTARFANFLRGPIATWRYVRGSDRLPERVGHNPLGGWSVVALLAVMLLQVGLGLFAVDVDGLESGPLSDAIGFDAGRIAADLHELNFNLLLAFIGLHIVAILFYLFVRRRNLVGPMVTGSMASDERIEEMAPAAWPRLLLTTLAAGAATWWISAGAPVS